MMGKTQRNWVTRASLVGTEQWFSHSANDFGRQDLARKLVCRHLLYNRI